MSGLEAKHCVFDIVRTFNPIQLCEIMLREMGMLEHLICLIRMIRLIRTLDTKQEGTESTEYGETEWFGIGKGFTPRCILSPYLFNLYSEYIMRKSSMDDIEAGVRIWRKMNRQSNGC